MKAHIENFTSMNCDLVRIMSIQRRGSHIIADIRTFTMFNRGYTLCWIKVLKSDQGKIK